MSWTGFTNVVLLASHFGKACWCSFPGSTSSKLFKYWPMVYEGAFFLCPHPILSSQADFSHSPDRFFATPNIVLAFRRYTWLLKDLASALELKPLERSAVFGQLWYLLQEVIDEIGLYQTFANRLLIVFLPSSIFFRFLFFSSILYGLSFRVVGNGYWPRLTKAFQRLVTSDRFVPDRVERVVPAPGAQWDRRIPVGRGNKNRKRDGWMKGSWKHPKMPKNRESKIGNENYLTMMFVWFYIILEL